MTNITDTARATAAPAEVTLGGRAYRLSPLTDGDVGELDNWVRASTIRGCLGVVIGFGESSSLAGAYGIAVTGTMTITSILYLIVITRVWRWSYWMAVPLVTVFLVFDISYFGANLLKVREEAGSPFLRPRSSRSP